VVIRLPICLERIAGEVELTRAERHYLLDVLRLSAGASLEVFDGLGSRYPARLVSGDRLELGSQVKDDQGLRRLVLAQALAKGEKMDLVAQKATELGASGLAPFTAARSVVKLDTRRAVERVKRWQRIADEAARQCGRADVPVVSPLGTLAEILEKARFEGAAALVLSEQEKARRLSEALLETAGPVVLVVGPEGGFTSEEMEACRTLGARAVTLGRRILRTETAGLVALAVARFLDGDLA
jgi:16S rRNA (uracil1498-N3)-methyltransferase